MRVYIWHTLRYRSYFSPTGCKKLKIKRLKNCFKLLFSRCRIFFYIYLDHIENFGMNCGVQSSNFCFIFKARTKSPHDVRKNTIFSDIMQGFWPSFKNEAEIWLFNTSIHARILNFLKTWHVTELWHLFCMIWSKYM